MKTREQQIDFIRTNGIQISSCAWNGFQKKGRGMVCVPGDLENEILGTVPFDFMPATDAARLFNPWEGSREAGMVASYDPEIEIVICFVRSGHNDRTDIDCYKFKTRPTPRESAERE